MAAPISGSGTGPIYPTSAQSTQNSTHSASNTGDSSWQHAAAGDVVRAFNDRSHLQGQPPALPQGATREARYDDFKRYGSDY